MNIVDFDDLKLDSVLGSGSEGTVYSSNKIAVKTFRCITENKLNKLKILSQQKLKKFIFPIDLVSEQNDIIGYTMKNVNGISLVDILENNEIDIKIKKKYLMDAQNLLKKAHKNNIIMGDLNFENFIIKNKQLYAIDTDNYKIKNYDNDIMPGYVYPYYAGKINKNINEDSDKFLFSMNILRHLYRDNFIDGAMIGYCKDYDYINDPSDGLLTKIKLHRDLIKYYKDLSTENETKEYIGNRIMLF